MNDELRAAHDYYGHAQRGHQFGPVGEENAAREHGVMFSEPAMDALFSETRGQNSWVNFGRHIRREDGSIPKKGDPDYVPLEQRPYAEQKSGLLPAQFRTVAPYGPFKAMAVVAPAVTPYVDTGNEDLDAAIRIGLLASSAAVFGAAAWHQLPNDNVRARVLTTGMLAIKKSPEEIRQALKSQGFNLSDKEFARAIDFSTKKLADINEATRGQFTDIDAIKVFVDEGLRHRRWYEEGVELIATGRKEGWIRDDKDAEVFAGFLGAMGSNNPPKQNFRDAYDLFKSWKDGTLRLGANGKLIVPKGWNDKTPGMDGIREVLRGAELGGRKINTYGGQMAGRPGFAEKLTADRWMARLHGFGDKSRAGLGDIDDHTYEAMEQLWKQIADDYGISTQQAQAAGWYGIRSRQGVEIAERTGKWKKPAQGHPMLQQYRLLQAERRWIDKGYYAPKIIRKGSLPTEQIGLTRKGMQLIGNRAKLLESFLKTKDGGTVNLFSGEVTVGKRGDTAVTAFPERTLVIPKGIKVTQKHLQAFMQDNLDLLEEPDVNIGVWRDKDGRTWLDLSLILKDKQTALREASRRGEQAVFSGRDGVVEAPKRKGLPDVGGVYDRIADLRSKIVPTGSTSERYAEFTKEVPMR